MIEKQLEMFDANRPDYAWLNEESITYLQRGYLLPGVTAIERINQIANYAESILKEEGFAEKFKHHMARGHFSLSSPVWSNFGLDRGLSIACVVGDTWINTEDSGKQARDIKVGDKVLTHKNRFQKVTKIMPTKDRGDIYKLKVLSRMSNLYITGNHPVLTNLGWVKVEDLNPRIHLIAVNGALEYEAKDHMIDVNNGSSFEKIKVDEDISWFMGVWFAEGRFSRDAQGELNGIRVTFDYGKEEDAKRWSNILKEKFGIESFCNVKETQKHKWLQVDVTNRLTAEFFQFFGQSFKEKLMPEWLINLPKYLLEQVLDGILLRDRRERGNIKITLPNPNLILQIYNIGLKLGKDMSLNMKEKSTKFDTTSTICTIVFKSHKDQDKQENFDIYHGVKFENGLSYCPIHTLEKTDKIEDVYDFTVEEDHSFSCAGVVVHNCFGSVLDDSIEGILETHAEVGMMSKYGGGTSGYFGKLRPRGASIKNNGKSNGSFSFTPLFDTVINVISQGSSRRGHFAGYIDIDHADIEEWLTIRTEGSPIQNMYYGVVISDEFLQDMIRGDQRKRDIWAKVLQRKRETGVPYIMFGDNVNRGTVDVYKDKNLRIYASNLCSEIALPSTPDESFVCCLSSMNLLYWDEWKDTDAVKILTKFLDAVMTDFINRTEGLKFMEKARAFAIKHRALGLGVLGWHHYLQSKMIPFESFKAIIETRDIFSRMQAQALEASKELAETLGEPEILKGYGRRNTTLMAIAPTRSSSFILGGVSSSIEPLRSNYFIKELNKIRSTAINPALMKLLIEKGYNTEEVWQQIVEDNGSVKNLDFLTQDEKDVFKTFMEINPQAVIKQAAMRQKYIDQSQSLNLMINPNLKGHEINKIYLDAWHAGVKSIYYQYNVNASQELARNMDKEKKAKAQSAGPVMNNDSDCTSCEA